MTQLKFIPLALALALGAPGAFAADGKVSQTRLERLMAGWPDEIRENAELLVARYGLPDRVTATTLVWDVPDQAQQQAMVRTVGDRIHSAEAGEE